MHDTNHESENEARKRDEKDWAAETGEPAPTDFKKHIWLLIAILMTVVIAAAVARIWAATGGTLDSGPGTSGSSSSPVHRGR